MICSYMCYLHSLSIRLERVISEYADLSITHITYCEYLYLCVRVYMCADILKYYLYICVYTCMSIENVFYVMFTCIYTVNIMSTWVIGLLDNYEIKS